MMVEEGTTSSHANATVLCEILNSKTVSCNDEEFYSELELIITPQHYEFWIYLGVYMVLVLFAGMMSGLTMGLLSLDKMSLEVLKRGGKPRQKKYAARILQIVKRHHLLLVTLLLANAVAVEAMPVFLSKITSEIVAIIVSVTAVLLFGEIVPQALCTRFGLAIGYYCSPLVIVLMVAFLPISFPIALFLDFVLGSGHGTFFRRAELRELVKMHGTHDKNEDPLSFDEVLILKGALDMRYKTVEDAMTPLESVYMLDITRSVDGPTMKEIIEKGHSRIPIYKGERKNICGLLLVKKLIQLDPEDCTPIQTLKGAQMPPPSCMTTMPLYQLLNHFQTGRSHLSIVYRQGEHDSELELVGIITLEDVIEELIGEEIVDETDQYIDVHRRIVVARARLANIQHTASAPVGMANRVQEVDQKRPKLMTVRSYSQPDIAATPLRSPQDNPPPEKPSSHPISDGGLDLEAIYNAATPISREDLLEDEVQEVEDESEGAPLIIN